MSIASKVPIKETALLLSKQSPPQVSANASHYVQCMTGNANFPAPSPSLASVTALITALDNAYDVSLTRVRGSVSKMRVALKKLCISLKALAAYVESTANADPDNASNIIASSGMPEKKAKVRAPKGFTAKAGKLMGSVVLNTKAVKGSAYIYQMTTDPTNPASWVTICTVTKVRFTKTGLTSGTRYYFRVAVSTKSVQSDWSFVLNVLVD
jgi:hypothetical protein